MASRSENSDVGRGVSGADTPGRTVGEFVSNGSAVVRSVKTWGAGRGTYTDRTVRVRITAKRISGRDRTLYNFDRATGKDVTASFHGSYAKRVMSYLIDGETEIVIGKDRDNERPRHAVPSGDVLARLTPPVGEK